MLDKLEVYYSSSIYTASCAIIHIAWKLYSQISRPTYVQKPGICYAVFDQLVCTYRDEQLFCRLRFALHSKWPTNTMNVIAGQATTIANRWFRWIWLLKTRR